MSNRSNDSDVLLELLSDIQRLFRTIEVSLLCGLFLGLIILGLTQIGLRNLADSSLPWSDAAMRAGVLWIAMIASCVAASESKHIKIDLLSRLVAPFWARWIGRIMLVSTSIICLLLVWASLDIVRIELEFQELAFLGIPRWFVLSIIPTGFAIMAFRFMLNAFLYDPADEKISDSDLDGKL